MTTRSLAQLAYLLALFAIGVLIAATVVSVYFKNYCWLPVNAILVGFNIVTVVDMKRQLKEIDQKR